MKEIISTVTSKGQITLPAEIRKHLGVTVHDKVAFVIDEEGAVQVRPLTYPDIDSLRGAAGCLPQPLSWEEMRDIAREDYLAAEHGSDE